MMEKMLPTNGRRLYTHRTAVDIVLWRLSMKEKRYGTGNDTVGSNAAHGIFIG